MPPLLITTWKRYREVSLLIENIRKISPKKIYVSSDGPNLRIKGNKEKVIKTRNVIIKNIDWPCEVKTLFSSENNGCKKGMIKAINWFFENEKEGIILEEDCIPSEEFFVFCSELLEKYRNDDRVWSISGSNFQDGLWRGSSSYYFSKYFHCWGWATWRNRWVKFDFDLHELNKAKNLNLLNLALKNPKERVYWFRLWDKLVREGKPDSWAYRCGFNCLINNGLSIIPNKNLVKNIGLNKEGTNTNFAFVDSKISNGIIPLHHPASVEINEKADNYTFYNHYSLSIWSKLKKILKNPTHYFNLLISDFFINK